MWEKQSKISRRPAGLSPSGTDRPAAEPHTGWEEQPTKGPARPEAPSAVPQQQEPGRSSETEGHPKQESTRADSDGHRNSMVALGKRCPHVPLLLRVGFVLSHSSTFTLCFINDISQRLQLDKFSSVFGLIHTIGQSPFTSWYLPRNRRIL